VTAPGRPDDPLALLRRLQAIAATGLQYATDPHDIARYTELREIAADLAGAAGDERIAALMTDDAGHPTPKVDVRGALFRDGRVLLVRERSDGLWTFPGGWADLGDTPRQAVEREVREESGWQVRATRLFAVDDRDRHNQPPHVHRIYKLFFLCEPRVAVPGDTDHEIDGTGFFSLGDLPPLSTGRTSLDQIERAFAHRADPSLPTEFD
jgi:ADP-ribose pyrophosphatase YjhB (NUDIX family)